MQVEAMQAQESHAFQVKESVGLDHLCDAKKIYHLVAVLEDRNTEAAREF